MVNYVPLMPIVVLAIGMTVLPSSHPGRMMAVAEASAVVGGAVPGCAGTIATSAAPNNECKKTTDTTTPQPGATYSCDSTDRDKVCPCAATKTYNKCVESQVTCSGKLLLYFASTGVTTTVNATTCAYTYGGNPPPQVIFTYTDWSKQSVSDCTACP